MIQESPLQRSLKTLVNQRFSVLSRRLRHGARRSGSYQNVLSEALLSEIRKEILSTLDDLLGNELKRLPDGSGEEPGDGTECRCRCCAQGGQGPCTTLPPWYTGNGGCFGRGQMEITLDQMIAETLMHGRQTSGVLRALFGLVPLLIGR